jgi:flagellar hook-associated protein 3 FlgL
MTIRPTQNTTFDLVQSGIASNYAKLFAAQQQVSSGKRISKPSDDAVGSATVLSLRRRLAEIARHTQSLASAEPVVQAGISALTSAGEALSAARVDLVSGLNGTLNADDRKTLAQGVRLLRDRLIELANSRFDGRSLFAGTAVDTQSFTQNDTGVVYQGDEGELQVATGDGQKLSLGIPGSELFAKREPGPVTFTGVTGAASGITADEGSGYAELVVRHDATSGALGAGLALVAGGANDTFLGDRTLSIDSAAGTARFGAGPAVAIPSGAAASDVLLTDEHGATVHLDFSAWSGGDLATTLSGAGSVSLDGSAFAPLDLSDQDLELSDAAHGIVLHVDATGIVRAGSDLVGFSGAADTFEVLQGVIDDLENTSGLDNEQLTARLSSRLGELDRNFENVDQGVAALGMRATRIGDDQSRLEGLDLGLKGVLSKVEEADLSSVVLDMTRAEQTLELAHATGARLMQRTLLDYLR